MPGLYYQHAVTAEGKFVGMQTDSVHTAAYLCLHLNIYIYQEGAVTYSVKQAQLVSFFLLFLQHEGKWN